MAPISSQTPRIVIYYQTHHTPSEVPVSVLPLVTSPNISITHLIVAAIHLNDPPGEITLNDHVPHHPRNQTLWAELEVLRATGIKVLGMLGGAAKGSFTRLDLDENTFEMYYLPLRDLIRSRNLDGLDLDVEEFMTLDGIIRLIDRLKSDFGADFIVTLAPVAAALMSGNPEHNLSGFDYEALEVMRGSKISWYNTQFYCNWGDMSNTFGYDAIVRRGFPPQKVVAGIVTNPGNGTGWVPWEALREVLITLRERYGHWFGGVMGWEFFNSLPGGHEKPWEWAAFMSQTLRRIPLATSLVEMQDEVEVVEEARSLDLADAEEDNKDAELPKSFEYFTDGSTD